jgi:hypothetical protein
MLMSCGTLYVQTGFLGAFGGGILSALVLQQPQRAGIALFEVREVDMTQVLPWQHGWLHSRRAPLSYHLILSHQRRTTHCQGGAQDAENHVVTAQDNTIGIVWTLCWWAMMYSPGDSVSRLHSLLPVRMLTKARTTSSMGVRHVFLVRIIVNAAQCLA